MRPGGLKRVLAHPSRSEDNMGHEESQEVTVESYELTIDPKRTFDQLVHVGNYDFRHEAITEEYFPMRGTSGGLVRAKLVCFHRKMTDDLHESEVNAELVRIGLRRANVVQVLAFGAQHPEVQRTHVIISGAYCTRPPDEPLRLSGLAALLMSFPEALLEQSDDHREFLCLNGLGTRRELDLYWVDRRHPWHEACWFLAVPINTPD